MIEFYIENFLDQSSISRLEPEFSQLYPVPEIELPNYFIHTFFQHKNSPPPSNNTNNNNASNKAHFQYATEKLNSNNNNNNNNNSNNKTIEIAKLSARFTNETKRYLTRREVFLLNLLFFLLCFKYCIHFRAVFRAPDNFYILHLFTLYIFCICFLSSHLYFVCLFFASIFKFLFCVCFTYLCVCFTYLCVCLF